MASAEMRRCIALASVALGVAAASPAFAASPDPLPTYSPAYDPRSIDERGLWMEADEAEKALRDSPLVIRDAALNEYVRNVFCRTVGTDRCSSVRIYILEVPAVNAAMYPNGAMTLWSGLLLRARNEAELGSVLGHEFAHFELRHTLEAFKRRRSATDVNAWLSVLGALSNTDTRLTQWSIVGSVYSFNRKQEEQADLLGLKYLAASGYPPSAAADLWKHLMDEQDARAIGRKQKPKQRYAAGFFDSHPTELKRATDLAKYAQALGVSGDAKGANYRLALANHLPRFLSAQSKLNDFGGTEYLLSQIAAQGGWTAELWFARGELYRSRGNPRDLVSAAQFYKQAMAAGYAAPEVRRNLGLALLRSGNTVEGQAALKEYLLLEPSAPDAKAISALLAN